MIPGGSGLSALNQGKPRASGDDPDVHDGLVVLFG